MEKRLTIAQMIQQHRRIFEATLDLRADGFLDGRVPYANTRTQALGALSAEGPNVRLKLFTSLTENFEPGHPVILYSAIKEGLLVDGQYKGEWLSFLSRSVDPVAGISSATHLDRIEARYRTLGTLLSKGEAILTIA